MDTFQFFQEDGVILTSHIKEMIETTYYHEHLRDYATTEDAPASLQPDGETWSDTVKKHMNLAYAIENLHIKCSDRTLDDLPLSQSLCRDIWQVTVAAYNLQFDDGVKASNRAKKAKWSQYLAEIARAFLRLIPLELRLENNLSEDERTLHSYTITLTGPMEESMTVNSVQRKDGGLSGRQEIHALGASLVEQGYTQSDWTLQAHGERRTSPLDQGIDWIADCYNPDRGDLAVIAIDDEHDKNFARLLREVSSEIRQRETKRSQDL